MKHHAIRIQTAEFVDHAKYFIKVNAIIKIIKKIKGSLSLIPRSY